MCDTIGFINKKTNFQIFAKNSDREPDELQLLTFNNFEHLFENQDFVEENVYLNRSCFQSYEKFYDFLMKNEIKVKKEKYLKNNLKILHSALRKYNKNYKVILSQPVWLWGAEMGINEYGVAIGNEAVFSKELLSNSGLLGMDILRIMLQNAKTAEQAVNIAIDLIENFNQGGDGGYKNNLKYHNSFLIQDYYNIYVLETSSNHWAYKKIENGFLTISNTYTIKNDFNKIDDKTKRHLKFKKYNSFKKTYENKIYNFFTKGEIRYRYTGDYIKYHFFNRDGGTDILKLFDLLRSHKNDIKVFYDNMKKISNVKKLKKSKIKRSMAQICVHSGLVKSETTSSMVIQYINNQNKHNNNYNNNNNNKDNDNNYTDNGYGKNRFIIWLTGSKNPCTSLFKPILFNDVFAKHFTLDYFIKNNSISEKLIKKYKLFNDLIKEKRDFYESEYVNLVNKLLKNDISDREFNYKVLDIEKEYLSLF